MMEIFEKVWACLELKPVITSTFKEGEDDYAAVFFILARNQSNTAQLHREAVCNTEIINF